MKKLFKYLVTLIYKPILAKYLSSTRTYSYKGVRLIIPPGVFHPGFFFSTKILLNFLSKQSMHQKTFLELGAGSGLIAIYAAKKGAIVTASDINPIALEYLEKNRQNNSVPLTIINSDLFSAIPACSFDIIAINPPYFKKDPRSFAESAWYCGSNGQYFEKLFMQIGTYIHADTLALIILSEACELEMISQYAVKYGWKLKRLLKRYRLIEYLTLYQLEPFTAGPPKPVDHNQATER